MALENADRAQHLAAVLKRKTSQSLGRWWWAFLIRGLLALALAVCAIVWPQKTVGLLVTLLGVYFLLDAVPALFTAWRSDQKFSSVLQAIVSLVIGLTLLLWPGLSAKLFLILIGAWAILQGGSLFLSSRKLVAGEPERGPLGTVGLVLAAVGLVFVLWPETGVVGVSWLIAAGAALIGGLLVFLATQLRRLRSAVDNLGTNLAKSRE
jgi:uncharacterized membrane protein HdeD (DUF308 family)